eukprot:snap_masked-scaffold_11-processed-gene-6.41-mRNA-1 protein AED:0.10 eAED:0.10 QI:0/-1/0/1/-1/1/1/0/257
MTSTSEIEAIKNQIQRLQEKLESLETKGESHGLPPQSTFPSDNSNYKSLEISEMPSPYKFFISAVIPRPIAFVSTYNEATDGYNLAPYSYFGLMCHNPPTLVFSPVNKGFVEKDTLQNIKKSEECVVNIISDWFIKKANICSGDYPEDVDEFKVAELETLDSEIVKAKRVKGAGVQFECKLNDLKEIKDDSGKVVSTMVIVRVVKAHVLEDIFDEEDGTVQSEKLKAVGRLGGVAYSTLGERYDLPRPRPDDYLKQV